MECLPQTLDDASESFANMTKCIAKIYFHDLCSFTASSNYCFCFHCFNRGTIATEITKLQKKNKKTVKNQKPWKPQSHSRGCKNTSRVDVETLCLSLLRTEELTNQCRLEILRGGLKETGTTTEHLKWWRIEMLQRWTVFSFFLPTNHTFDSIQKTEQKFFWLCLSILRSFIRSWHCQRNPFVGADCLYVAGECFITLHIVSLLLVVWSAFCYQCNKTPMCNVFFLLHPCTPEFTASSSLPAKMWSKP